MVEAEVEAVDEVADEETIDRVVDSAADDSVVKDVDVEYEAMVAVFVDDGVGDAIAGLSFDPVLERALDAVVELEFVTPEVVVAPVARVLMVPVVVVAVVAVLMLVVATGCPMVEVDLQLVYAVTVKVVVFVCIIVFSG